MTSRAELLQQETRALLAPYGLLPFGWFVEEKGCPALLIGNIGSSLWSAFSTSEFFDDGHKNQMDRWTASIVDPVAHAVNAQVRYPFGETVWPFQQYAKAATGMRQSPIGLLAHHEYGLWTAFRGALVFQDTFEIRKTAVLFHPCDHCLKKPCMNTCPVNAFSNAGYDHVSCRNHVRHDEGRVCREGGCLARHACPVGTGYAYEPAQQVFHMKAYI